MINMDMQAIIVQLSAKYPGRTKQITSLVEAVGGCGPEPPPTIFIYGGPATGKTAITTDVLHRTQAIYASADCIGCYKPRVLYEQLLNQLAGHVPSQSNGYSNAYSCDNMHQFTLLLKSLTTDKHNGKPIFLVLDHAERLRDTHSTELAALLRLGELISHPICTILITQCTWSRFYSGSGLRDPLMIPFTPYTRDHIIAIAINDCPINEDPGFFHEYIDFMSKVFYQATRDLNEIRHMVHMLFPVYKDPITKGLAKPTDTIRLIRHINPYLRHVINELYLREISSNDWIKLLDSQDMGGDKEEGEEVETTNKHVKVAKLADELKKKDIPELSRYSKYLLCAAYLASNNPSSTDKRFFVKLESRRRHSKVKKPVTKKHKIILRSPKVFPMERLMAIFYTIVEDTVTDTSLINIQLSSLVSLGYLTQTSAEDSLDNLRYRCNAPQDLIEMIARSVGFDMTVFLYRED